MFHISFHAFPATLDLRARRARRSSSAAVARPAPKPVPASSGQVHRPAA